MEKNSYPIYIDKDLLGSVGEILKRQSLSAKAKVVMIGDYNACQLYGNLLMESLKNAQLDAVMLSVPPGERSKSLKWASKLYDQLLENRIDRSSTVIALGGGVVGDLAGFVAATFMRGLPLIQIPTTLLAQVDSSVGGKTAVNHLRVKNLIGFFYQPKLVLIDISTLKTLPKRELKAGLAEVVKYGVINDEEFFQYLEENVDKILQFDLQKLEQMVIRSCKIKVMIVEQDEKEANIRAFLNYGHTIGHAVESLTSYRHGEAIAIGMTCEAKIAVDMELLAEESFVRQTQLLKKIGLPVRFPDISPEEILNLLYADKKVRYGKLRFVLPKKIGEVVISNEVSDEQVLKAIEACKE